MGWLLHQGKHSLELVGHSYYFTTPSRLVRAHAPTLTTSKALQSLCYVAVTADCPIMFTHFHFT
jgi:hypothetical protein